MTRTRKGTKPPGYDYWGKRKPNSGYGKEIKKLTHTNDRIIDKEQIEKGIKDAQEEKEETNLQDDNT